MPSQSFALVIHLDKNIADRVTPPPPGDPANFAALHRASTLLFDQAPRPPRRLLAKHYAQGNREHQAILRDFGITVHSLADGRVQLTHTTTAVGFFFKYIFFMIIYFDFFFIKMLKQHPPLL